MTVNKARFHLTQPFNTILRLFMAVAIAIPSSLINIGSAYAAVAPVIAEGDMANLTMSEDGAPTAFALTLHASDEDVEDTLTWSILTGAANGTATAEGTGNSIAVGYAPAANYNGTDNFLVQVTDGTDADTITVNVTVEAVNDTPIVADIPNQTIAEGGTFATINLDDYVTDVEDGAAQMTWTHSGNTSLLVSITDRVATITTPNADWNGTETITFRAADTGALFAENAATFTVTAVNDAPPVITESDPQAVGMSEDSAPTAFGLTLHATDADPEDTLTWSILTGAANGSATASGTGALKLSGTRRMPTTLELTVLWCRSQTATAAQTPLQ